MLQVVPATKQPREIKERVHQFFKKFTIPRGVQQPTTYDMGLGKELPQDLKGKIVWERGHIGEGGFAKVYRGKCKLGRNKIWVAIKFLEMRAGPNMDVKITQYLHRETLVWRDLKHPNVLPLLGICSGLNNPTTCVPALISPYCPHGNLKEYLELHPDVPRLPLARQVASAVQYLHVKNIIHGDIKPDNILVDEECRPLLADFGRSRIIGVNGFETTLTSSQHYTAPELLNYEDDIVPLTKPSDIFSLSVTLLRVMTDRGPFYPRKGPVLIGLFRDGKKPALKEYLDHPLMSVGLWDQLDKGWSYDPAERQNADEFVIALEALPSEPTSVEEVIDEACISTETLAQSQSLR